MDLYEKSYIYSVPYYIKVGVYGRYSESATAMMYNINIIRMDIRTPSRNNAVNEWPENFHTSYKIIILLVLYIGIHYCITTCFWAFLTFISKYLFIDVSPFELSLSRFAAILSL